MQNFTVSEHEKLNTAVALGFFDGLHKGHRRVILSAVEQKKNGLCPCALHLLKARRRFSENLLRVRL